MTRIKILFLVGGLVLLLTNGCIDNVHHDQYGAKPLPWNDEWQKELSSLHKVPPPIRQTYEITFYGKVHEPCAFGLIKIIISPEKDPSMQGTRRKIEGSWRLTITDAGFSYQSMGELYESQKEKINCFIDGLYCNDDSYASIDLNPGASDNNVYLNFVYLQNGDIAGSWYYVTYANVSVDGTFYGKPVGIVDPFFYKRKDLNATDVYPEQVKPVPWNAQDMLDTKLPTVHNWNHASKKSYQITLYDMKHEICSYGIATLIFCFPGHNYSRINGTWNFWTTDQGLQQKIFRQLELADDKTIQGRFDTGNRFGISVGLKDNSGLSLDFGYKEDGSMLGVWTRVNSEGVIIPGEHGTFIGFPVSLDTFLLK